MPTEDAIPRSAALRGVLDKTKHSEHAGRAALSVAEACKQIGIGKTTLYKLIRKKRIESMKVGKRRLISLKAVERFIEQHEKEEAEA